MAQNTPATKWPSAENMPGDKHKGTNIKGHFVSERKKFNRWAAHECQ